MEAPAIWLLIGFFLNLGGAVACTLAAAYLSRQDVRARRERGAAIIALAITAAWCVTSAAWGPSTPAANFIESARNLAWIVVLYRLFGNDGRDQLVAPIRPMVFALGFVECLQPVVILLDVRFGGVPAVREAAFAVCALLRALVAVGALVLLHNLYAGASAVSRQVLRWPAAGLTGMFAFQLTLYVIAWIVGAVPAELGALHGVVAASVALLFTLGSNARAAELKIVPSRAVAFQSLSLVVIGAYLTALVLLGQSVTLLGGDAARLTQVGLVFAAAVAALLWLPSPRLRGWIRVKAAKHLFQHRYDYRSEWLRFTQTIGRAGPDAPGLVDRAAQAMADITDSQGALLMLPQEEGRLELAGRWQWEDAAVPTITAGSDLAGLLERTESVIELDAVREGTDQFSDQAMPGWVCEDPRAWAIVPLIHFERLVGLVILARPSVVRSLDWEDFDLLKVVGRQLASYLAEQAGHQALTEAARFDEFNRRMAFVMHDIKNLASQLSLLARNTERHADNPEFRKDMLVTLTKSAEKLNALLARLGRYGAQGSTQRVPIDLADVARSVARRYQGLHPIELARLEACRAIGDGEALEQALAHLVQNAVDASTPDSPVKIDVSSDGIHGRVEVIDGGPGMSARFLRESLFKPFVSSKEGGFGIGAFEARELVRAMGGRLEVESREGLGSRFSITLPLSATVGFIGASVPEREVA